MPSVALPLPPQKKSRCPSATSTSVLRNTTCPSIPETMIRTVTIILAMTTTMMTLDSVLFMGIFYCRCSNNNSFNNNSVQDPQPCSHLYFSGSLGSSDVYAVSHQLHFLHGFPIEMPFPFGLGGFPDDSDEDEDDDDIDFSEDGSSVVLPL